MVTKIIYDNMHGTSISKVKWYPKQNISAISARISGVGLAVLVYLAMKASGPTAHWVCLDYLWFTGGVTTGSRVQLNWGSHPKHSMKSNWEWTVDINKDGRQVFTSYYCTDAWANIVKIRRLTSLHCDLICTYWARVLKFQYSQQQAQSKQMQNVLCKGEKEKKIGGRVSCDPWCACRQGSDLCFD